MKKILFFAQLVCLLCAGQVHAASFLFCDREANLTAAEKNQVLNFSSVVKDVLEKSGSDAAIISRSGTDLTRFHIRYSHSGFTLKKNENTPWSVRQLYYGCEDQKPSIFDQGLSGFLMTHDDNIPSYVSVLLLPKPETDAMAKTALDNKLSVELLGNDYSANAYAFSTIYQNCNQWVAEMLAFAWGNLSSNDDFRNKAQAWLKANAYKPTDIDAKYSYVVWVGHMIPLLHTKDHPSENIDRKIFQVSMPAAIEEFVKNRVDNVSRVEMCLKDNRIVIHRGWDSIADGCIAGPEDDVLPAS
nr:MULTISPECIES: DUF2145 domain-containing protein [unclassified Herbaspirillum]